MTRMFVTALGCEVTVVPQAPNAEEGTSLLVLHMPAPDGRHAEVRLTVTERHELVQNLLRLDQR